MGSSRTRRAGLLTRANRSTIHPGLEEVDLFLRKRAFPDLDDEAAWELLDSELGDHGTCDEAVESPREYRFFTFGPDRDVLERACRAAFRRLGGGSRGGHLRIFAGPETDTYQRVELP